MCQAARPRRRRLRPLAPERAPRPAWIDLRVGRRRRRDGRARARGRRQRADRAVRRARRRPDRDRRRPGRRRLRRLGRPASTRARELVNEPGRVGDECAAARPTRTARSAFYGARVRLGDGSGRRPVTMLRVPGYVGGEPEQPVPRDVVAVMARRSDGGAVGLGGRLLGRRRRCGGRAAEELGGRVWSRGRTTARSRVRR